MNDFLSNSSFDNRSQNEDEKVSALFKMKVESERPSGAFWSQFESQLQQKLENQHKETFSKKIISWWSICQQKVLRYTSYAACATLCLLTLTSKKTEPIGPEELTPSERYAVEELSIKHDWRDTTLKLQSESNRLCQYVQNNVASLGLNSSTREFSF